MSKTSARLGGIGRALGGTVLFFVLYVLISGIVAVVVTYLLSGNVIYLLAKALPVDKSTLDRFRDLCAAIPAGLFGVTFAALALGSVIKDYPARVIGWTSVIWLVANYLLHFIFFPQNTDFDTYYGLLLSSTAIATAWVIFRLPPMHDVHRTQPHATGGTGRRTSENTAATPKTPTMMDGFIKLAYGDSPPPKTAKLQDAIELSYVQLLGRIVDIAEVRSIATQLYEGPIPYSTHDLAVATALNLFRSGSDGPRREQFAQIQILVRMIVLEWMKEKKVVPMLAKSFEDTLYERYKP